MCIDKVLHKYLHSDNGMDWHISLFSNSERVKGYYFNGPTDSRSILLVLPTVMLVVTVYKPWHYICTVVDRNSGHVFMIIH